VTHFVRTSVRLKVNDSEVEGAVYRAVEKPQFFYVVNGDAMLELNLPFAYNPGVGGFSMHAQKSRNFIVALNMAGGVPFLTSSPVRLGKVSWMGHDYDRLRPPRG
jgi:hypothetical protein